MRHQPLFFMCTVHVAAYALTYVYMLKNAQSKKNFMPKWKQLKCIMNACWNKKRSYCDIKKYVGLQGRYVPK